MQLAANPQGYAEVKTRDIFHAAYLVSMGMEIREILPDTTYHKSKAIFLVGGHGLADFEQAYRNGKVTVNVFTLKECVKHVKDVMFDYLRTSGHL